GLSIIFISHKLHEVMAVSDRVLVLRAGRLAGECVTAGSSRSELASLMVGQDVASPTIREPKTGSVLLALKNVSTAGQGSSMRLDDISLALRAGEITGLAGVSGNGQATLAALIAGTLKPSSGTMTIRDA